MADRSDITSIGVVTEALPNATFRIQMNDGKEVLGYLSGKMRLHKIKVLTGDKVRVTTSAYGEDKGRIIQRM